MGEAETRRIGPYRLQRRLGGGGMGVVYEAYHSELDRRVAVKRIREDVIDAERGERFRREARLAAQLNHPSIVQVYDIIREEDVDYIVMEYVEGSSLRHLIKTGGLDLNRKLGLAKEIARGLSAAHESGIVHRDLKTENVLVTRSLNAKIADFGIAKQMLHGGSPEESLTRASTVIGTCRVMSPEQAKGQQVDYRSDLFSFGVLLYETFSGRSPFEGDNELATLNRIIQQEQDPLVEVVAEAPPLLSELVDHLLEKDPLLRPRSATEVVDRIEEIETSIIAPQQTKGIRQAPTQEGILQRPSTWPAPEGASPGSNSWSWAAIALLLLAIMAAIFYVTSENRPDPISVAVLRPEVGSRTETDEIELIASGVRVALQRTLLSLEGVSALTPSEIDAVSDSNGDVPRAVAAREAVTSRLDCQGRLCRVTLQRVRALDSKVLWTDIVDFPSADFHLQATAVMSGIRDAYPDRQARGENRSLDVLTADYKKFLELRDLYASRRPGVSLDSILEEVAAVRRSSPLFMDAYLLEAQILRFRFSASRDSNDLDEAYRLLKAARELEKTSSQPLYLLVRVSGDAGRWDEAEKALQELERLDPGSSEIPALRAWNLQLQGEAERALELMRSAVELRPSALNLRNLSNMEYQQGLIQDAILHLNQALQRAPMDFKAEFLLAQIELMNGDPEEAVRHWENLVERSPGNAELTNLGLSHLLLGRHEEAAASLEKALALAPQSPWAVINLADAYSLMGKEDESRKQYETVLRLVDGDAAGQGWQLLTVKAQAQARLGLEKESLANIEQARRLAPESGQVFYEASLVCALVGDTTAAKLHAERALARGFEPRWFNFPWFDSLKEDEEFKALLAGEEKILR